jgi:hypothetical protein
LGGIVELGEIIEILAAARRLLEDPSHWSPVHMAADANGRWVPVGDTSAERFNLQGAVIRAAGFRAREVMKMTESALGACSSEGFARTLMSPGSLTHSEALAWLDGAASLLAMLPARYSSSGVSGLMLKVSEAQAIARRTTGTDDDDD